LSRVLIIYYLPWQTVWDVETKVKATLFFGWDLGEGSKKGIFSIIKGYIRSREIIILNMKALMSLTNDTENDFFVIGEGTIMFVHNEWTWVSSNVWSRGMRVYYVVDGEKKKLSRSLDLSPIWDKLDFSPSLNPKVLLCRISNRISLTWRVWTHTWLRLKSLSYSTNSLILWQTIDYYRI